MSRLKLPNRSYRAGGARAWGHNHYTEHAESAIATYGYNAGYAQALRDVHKALKAREADRTPGC